MFKTLLLLKYGSMDMIADAYLLARDNGTLDSWHPEEIKIAQGYMSELIRTGGWSNHSRRIQVEIIRLRHH